MTCGPSPIQYYLRGLLQNGTAIVLVEAEATARKSLALWALVWAAVVGALSAGLTVLFSPAIGITACAYGLFAVGFFTGKSWKDYSLPPGGGARRTALVSGAVGAALAFPQPSAICLPISLRSPNSYS